jgi:hypothetical protein
VDSPRRRASRLDALGESLLTAAVFDLLSAAGLAELVEAKSGLAVVEEHPARAKTAETAIEQQTPILRRLSISLLPPLNDFSYKEFTR